MEEVHQMPGRKEKSRKWRRAMDGADRMEEGGGSDG